MDDDQIQVHRVKPKLTPPAKDIKNEKNPEPVKSDNWRNLYFKTDGKFGLGNYNWPSEQKAKDIATRMIFEWQILSLFSGHVLCFCNGVHIKFEEFSHVMQIPWEKED